LTQVTNSHHVQSNSQSSSSSSGFPAPRPDPSHHNQQQLQQQQILQSTVLGAGVGAGLAFARGENLAGGALGGAGLGLLGGLLLSSATMGPGLGTGSGVDRSDDMDMDQLFAMRPHPHHMFVTHHRRIITRPFPFLSSMEMMGMAPPLRDQSQQPANPAVLASLPAFIHTGEAEEQGCAICLDSFALGQRVLTLPCLHRFHETCATPWLRKKATCPVCKHPLPSQPEPN
jgi:hypothetical protein